MKITIHEELEIPESVEVEIEKGIVAVKGPKGESKRKLFHPRIKIEVKENKIIVESKNATKREKKMGGTYLAHLKNMLKGVKEPFIYKLKICHTHFPITASIENNKFLVKNLYGEQIPRTLKINPNVNIKIKEPEIIIESVDKELAGQTAADIEQICRITNRDKRIFQDGCYIISKGGKEIK